jgi:hypothetical protein
VDVRVTDPAGNSKETTVTVGESVRPYDPSFSILALLAVGCAVLIGVYLSWMYIVRRT